MQSSIIRKAFWSYINWLVGFEGILWVHAWWVVENISASFAIFDQRFLVFRMFCLSIKICYTIFCYSSDFKVFLLSFCCRFWSDLSSDSTVDIINDIIHWLSVLITSTNNKKSHCYVVTLKEISAGFSSRRTFHCIWNNNFHLHCQHLCKWKGKKIGEWKRFFILALYLI